MAKYYLIFGRMLFDIRFEGHIFALPTIRLRYQSFGIRLDNESRSRTPFAKIWKPLSCRESTLRLLLSFLEFFYDFNVHPIWLKDSTFLALPQVHPDPQWNLQKDLDFRFKRIYSWFNKYQVFYYEKIVILLNLTECKMLAWLDSVKYLHD